MKKIVLVGLLISLMAACPARALTYYVSNSGNDSNSGTSNQSPWKTVEKVNSYSFAPGDEILFQCGGIWRELLEPVVSGTASNPIVFGSYGAGAPPIISGSDLITTWATYSGNIYKASVATQPNIVYFNGVRGTAMSAASGVTAPDRYYWASGVLYAYSPSGTPNTYYTSPGVEAGARNEAVFTNNQTYLTFNGLDIRDGNGLWYSNFVMGWDTVQGIVVENCLLQRGNGHGIYPSADVNAANFTIDHCTIQNNGQWGILVDNLFSNGQISNNLITGNGWRSNLLDDNEYSGIEGYLGNLNIYNNEISNTAPNGCKNGGVVGPDYCHGIYNNTTQASTAVANIYQNYIHDNSGGDGIKTYGSANIYQNEIMKNGQAGVYLAGGVGNNAVWDVNDNLIANNSAATSVWQGGIFEDPQGSSGPDPIGKITLTISSNTLYNNANKNLHEITVNDDLASLTVIKNIISTTPSNSSDAAYYVALQTASHTINQNLVYQSSGSYIANYSGASYTWALWQQLEFDVNGINANPLFTNASGALDTPSDFILRSNSPAIGLGVDFLTTGTTPTPPPTPAPTPTPADYTITASAGSKGSISPSSASVPSGGSQTFTISPNKGYSVAGVTVDGAALSSPVTSYTFQDVTSDHTLAATFTASSTSNNNGHRGGR